MSTLDNAAIEAIVSGRHRYPFSVPGPNVTPAVTEIRAWLPFVEQASIVIGGQASPMERIHPSGFFVASLPVKPAEYRLCVGTYEFDDPYRFGPVLTPFELYLHGEGTNHESYRTLGAHLIASDGVDGVHFAVWAPTAELVSVVGDFNRWDRTCHPMRLRDGGIWEIFIPGLAEGA